MVSAYQWFRSLLSSSSALELDQQLADVVSSYKERAWAYQQNDAYHMGGTNVGSDMEQACFYVEELIAEFKRGRNSFRNCLNLHQYIMDHLDDYEENYRDAEGYGASTVQEIALDIKGLAEDQ